MKKYGLLGYPLGHSFSAKYFAERFSREGILDTKYDNFALEDISLLAGVLDENTDLQGFNVTIPYKQDVMAFVDHFSEEAEEIGAVNCVRIADDGQLYGFNTDVYGFRETLLELIGEKRLKALVLGTGGASKAVRYALGQLGIEYKSVSRKQTDSSICYEQVTAQLIRDYPLVVNTTPLGTYPNVDGCPALPYEALDSNNYFFDLVYNPPLTKFLAQAQEKGAHIMNGHRMLILQAEKSWEIWQSPTILQEF